MSDENPSVVQVRLTRAEKRRVQAAAALDGRSVSAWLRSLMQRALDEAEGGAAPQDGRAPR